ncbi:MAG: succinate dehydrogenase cytochrome b subunit [Sandaracinaceae bacterium]|nr:succinate dehydrogenase cytochrome b subunit [Sandaracinaceae bacterium]
MATAKALPLTQTSIGQKALVALTGVILYGFAFVHAVGNLQVFLGEEHYNAYAEMLQSMPKVVWATRVILLGSLVTHIALVLRILGRAREARPGRYRVDAPIANEQGILQRYARQTMILSGLIVFAYLAFHLVHLTIGVAPGLFFHRGLAYQNLVYGMREPWVAGVYLFANLLLGLHLFHGATALFQTLGLKHPQWDGRTKIAALGVVTLIVGANVIIPIACLTRIAGGELPNDPSTILIPDEASEGAED